MFDVLAHRVEHRDRVVLENELLDPVWGDRRSCACRVSRATRNGGVAAIRRTIEALIVDRRLLIDEDGRHGFEHRRTRRHRSKVLPQFRLQARRSAWS